jgi:hypothetical protein
VNRYRLISVIGITAVAVGVALAGCGSKTAAPISSTPAGTSTVAGPASSAAKPAQPKATRVKSFDDYLSANHITVAAPQIGAAGVPVVTLPVLAGWSHRELDAHEGYADLASVKDDSTPTGESLAVVRVEMAKLTGDIDQSKLLAAAKPNHVDDPIDKFRADPSAISISGFSGWQVTADTEGEEGKKLTIASRAVIIPGQDATYFLRVSAIASSDLEGAMFDALHLIDTQTTIKP